MKIGYYVTPLLKHQQFELDFGNFGTIALGRKSVIELIENLTAALEEHPASPTQLAPDAGESTDLEALSNTSAESTSQTGDALTQRV